MASLGVVALVSGGKDSLFSILHCLSNGHRLIALANLHPPQPEIQDMDSFMYQTVGHNVIDLIAQALEVPLYRQPIVGSALSSSRTYEDAVHNQGAGTDEVESMFVLLSRVKQALPEVNAVSTGAILSDYQRTRVESVAIRLGLTPLSYLWQFPFLPPYSEASLLQDMSSVGQDSRLIKVASGALDDSFLWKNVADPRTISRLQKAAARFGTNGDGSTIGEGGEYETLAIDGPGPLWKHKIRIEEVDRIMVSGDAGVATLEIKKASLEAKDALDTTNTSAVRRPPLLDDTFQELQDKLLQHLPDISTQQALSKVSDTIQLPTFESSDQDLKTVCNMTATGMDAGEQTKRIMEGLITDRAIVPQSVIHALILLKHMDDFQVVNTVYGSYFQRPNPPSRVTISCGDCLPENVLVSISFTHTNNAQSEQALHVQSRSYWAPANIGPYSQAISIPIAKSHSDAGVRQPHLVHIAGQIPLVPSSMEMISCPTNSAQKSPIAECVLSLQHLWRIGTVLDVNFWLGAVAFLSRTANAIPRERYLQTASQVWTGAHSPATEVPDANGNDKDSEDETDVWDRKYGGSRGVAFEAPFSTYRPSIKKHCTPPFFAAEVESLPRNSPLEWSSTGWTDTTSTFHVSTERSESSHHYRIYSRKRASKTLLAGWLALPSIVDAERAAREAQIPANILCIAYTTSALPSAVLDILRPQVVPCFRIWDDRGEELAAVVSYTVVPLDNV